MVAVKGGVGGVVGGGVEEDVEEDVEEVFKGGVEEGSKRDSMRESRRQSKRGSKCVSKRASARLSKEESRKESIRELMRESKREAKEVPKEASEEVLEVSKEVLVVSKNVSAREPKDVSERVSKNVLRKVSKKASKNVSKRVSKDVSKRVSKDVSKRVFKDATILSIFMVFNNKFFCEQHIRKACTFVMNSSTPTSSSPNKVSIYLIASSADNIIWCCCSLWHWSPPLLSFLGSNVVWDVLATGIQSFSSDFTVFFVVFVTDLEFLVLIIFLLVRTGFVSPTACFCSLISLARRSFFSLACCVNSRICS